MITVVESWYLKSGLEEEAGRILDEMEELLGPSAHAHPGWCGHARFFQSTADRSRLLVVYPWRSLDLLDDLLAAEEKILAPFYESYFRQRRQVETYRELAVEHPP